MHRQLPKRHSSPLPTRSHSDPLSPRERNSASSHFREIEQIAALTPAKSHLPSQTKVEPFTSPLTEINLKHHTESYPSSRQLRQMHVEYFVKVQNDMLQLEVELQRRRRAEISSLVPLDTRSVSEEIIQVDSLDEQTEEQQEQYQQQQQQEEEGGEEEWEGKPAKKMKRKWLHLIGRWLRSGKDKPAQTIQFQQPEREQQNEEQHQSSAASDSARISTPISFPAGPQIKGRRARHASWAHRDNLDQYKYHKQTLIRDSIHGLSDANIARALVEGRALSAIFLPHRTSSVKRDSAVFVQPSHLPSQGQQGQQQKQQKRSLSMRFAPQLGSLREEGGSSDRKPPIVAYRYPKMVSRQALRDAAIEVLCSDFSLWSDQQQLDSNNDDDNDEDVHFHNADEEDIPVSSILSHYQSHHPYYYPAHTYYHHQHHCHRHHQQQYCGQTTVAAEPAPAELAPASAPASKVIASHQIAMKRLSNPGIDCTLRQM